MRYISVFDILIYSIKQAIILMLFASKNQELCSLGNKCHGTPIVSASVATACPPAYGLCANALLHCYCGTYSLSLPPKAIARHSSRLLQQQFEEVK